MRAQVAGMLVVAVLGAGGRGAAASPGPGASSLPFVSSRPGEIVVPMTIGSRGPYRVLLDTGSTHTAISDALSTALGLPAVARTTMRASAGTLACLVVELPRVAIGSATADGLTATVLPAQAAAALGPGIDGLVGQDFLSRFRFTIDYRHLRIVWHERGYVASGVRLALVPSEDRWLVELPQRGHTSPWRFVPDSGTDTLVLYDDAAADRLVTQWRADRAALGSLTGSRIVRTGIVDGLRLGGASLERQLAVVLPSPSAGAGAPTGLLPLHQFASVFFSATDRCLVIHP